MVLDWILNNSGDIWTIIASVITVASIIVKLTPTQKDDAFLAKILNILGIVSLNKSKVKKKKK